ncbi:MAG: efflux RND transporter periplasmic adaptor subunit [Burkholderiales bacterium]
MRWILISLTALALLAGCKKEEAKPQALPEVSAIKVTSRDTPITLEYVGQTQSSHQVEIRARVNGFLEKRVYTEGSLVKAGQVMFQQDPKPYQATLDANKGALAQQQARLQVARDNLVRVKPLVALNALSQKDLDDATGAEQAAASSVDTARANVLQAQLNLGYTTIFTPVTGFSSYARVQDGAYVSVENSFLTYVEQVDPIWVNFSLSENELLGFRTERDKGLLIMPKIDSYDVEVVLADGSVFPKKGRITFANASYNQQTGTFLLRATIPNPEAVLRPGQFVRVRVEGMIRPKAILVPQKAVLNGAQGHFVWIVNKEGKAENRHVEVGPWYEDKWFITSGLAADDTLVVDGVMRLAPGASVKIVDAAKEAAAEAKPEQTSSTEQDKK